MVRGQLSHITLIYRHTSPPLRPIVCSAWLCVWQSGGCSFHWILIQAAYWAPQWCGQHYLSHFRKCQKEEREEEETRSDKERSDIVQNRRAKKAIISIVSALTTLSARRVCIKSQMKWDCPSLMLVSLGIWPDVLLLRYHFF